MMKIFKGSSGIILFIAIIMFASCEEDFNTVGTDLIGSNNFETERADFDVFAATRQLSSVRTNDLQLYRLGRLRNPIFGDVNASIVTQVTLPTVLPNGVPRFGLNSQEQEDNGETDDVATTVQENERVTRVVLNIPFFTNNTPEQDTDGDGVPDILDADPNDPFSDTDGDGISDTEEAFGGTDPLNPDSDGDGIPDGEDDSTTPNIFPQRFVIDSVFGNINTTFNLRIDEITFFLRDLDPNTNFQESQEYFSNMDFSSFLGANLFNGPVEVSDREVLIFDEDNENTPDIDESENILRRIPPGLRIDLDPEFFQQNLIDLEGRQEISNNSNFTEFFRGLQISADIPGGEDLLMLIDLTSANIDVEYDFDRLDVNGTVDDTSDDFMVEEDATFFLELGGVIGNRVNVFEDSQLSTTVINDINRGTDATRLYLNGGASTFVEIDLFEQAGETTILEEIRANGWLINEANLVFNVDRDQLDAAGNIIEPTRIYLYNLTNNAVLLDWLFDPTQDENSPTTSRVNYGGILETNDEGKGTQYRIRLTQHMNNILRNDSTNVKLGLTVTSNINDAINITALNAVGDETVIPQASVLNPFGTVLIGGTTDPEDEDRRLRLEIFYTETTQEDQ